MWEAGEQDLGFGINYNSSSSNHKHRDQRQQKWNQVQFAGGEGRGIEKSIGSGGIRRPERTFQFSNNGEQNQKLNIKCKHNENSKQFIININQNKAAEEMQ